MSEQPPTPPSKRDVILALLEHAEAQVHLDARRPGVELPPKLRASSNVRLDYGYGLTPPIPDLSIDEDGIRATLSFNRTPFPTFVPWSSIFLIADFAGRGAVWREDLPPELVVHTEVETPQTEPEVPPPRRFGVLDGDVGRKEATTDDRPPPENPKPQRPALRLVK